MTAGLEGKRDIKRSETVRASRWANGAPGMAAIIEASLLAAARRGNCARLAASSQGSTPSRASTESTLSGVSSLFLSIRANRKLSNLSVRLETEAEFVILITGFHTLDLAQGSAERRGNSICCAAAPRVRLGNYLRCGISKGALTSSPFPTRCRGQLRAVQWPSSGSVTLLARNRVKPAHFPMQLLAVPIFYNVAT